jgi:endonuclease YncB( thermonuclease family)
VTGNIRQIRTTKAGEPDSLRQLVEEPPKRRRSPWFWLFVALFTGIGFAAVYLRHDMAAALKPKPGAPEQLSAADVQVIDSNTIRLAGRQVDVRLMGFQPPETVHAKCDDERERGYTVMRRLRSIIERTELQLQSVPCGCAPQTEGTEACNLGKRCGILRANGWDVGERLIAEGLALRVSCSGGNCKAHPAPWCDAR